MGTNIQSSKTDKVFDIHERIFNFVVRVLNLTKSLPKTAQNYNIVGQISRSVTSMGANAQEADGSNSRRQFLNNMLIAKKETKETNYWLKIIYATNIGFQKRMGNLIQEGKEIEAIVSSIVEKTKKN